MNVRLLGLLSFLLLLMVPLGAGAESESVLAYGITWSPDGQWLAVSSEQGAWFFDPGNPAAEPRRYLVDSSVPVIAFDPTGAVAALADSTNDHAEVSVIEVETGETLYTFYPPKSPDNFASVIYDMRFIDDGRYLAVGNTSVLTVYDMQTGTYVASVELKYGGNSIANWITSITGSGEPGVFVVSNWNNMLIVYDSVAKEVREQHEISGELYMSVALHLGDTRYALLDSAGIYRYDLDTESLALIELTFEGRTAGFALSADRRWLAVGGEAQWALYDLEEDAVLLDIQGIDVESEYLRPYVFGFAFNPDASQLATLQVDGVITIWDTGTGEIVATLGDFDRAVSYRWG